MQYSTIDSFLEKEDLLAFFLGKELILVYVGSQEPKSFCHKISCFCSLQTF